MSKASDAIRRAKALLGDTSEPVEPAIGRMEAFDKLAAEARAYLAGAGIAEDVGIEIKFAKGDFEASFERS